MQRSGGFCVLQNIIRFSELVYQEGDVMKKWIFILTLPLWLLVFSSCDTDEGYSLDKYSVNLATVKMIDQHAGTYYLLLDNRQKLWPAAQKVYFTPEEGNRVLANYTLLSDRVGGYDHYIRINSISKVLLKSVIELNQSNKDSIGNNAVSIEDIWFSGKYLNVMFGYWGSGHKTHFINLVNNTTVAHPMDNCIYLELRHNANNDAAVQRFHGLVSFDLANQLIGGQTASRFSVLVLTENEGEKSFKFTADFVDWVSNSNSLLMSVLAFKDHSLN